MCQNCSKELAKTYDPKGIEGVTGVLNIFAVLGHWVMGRKEKK